MTLCSFVIIWNCGFLLHPCFPFSNYGFNNDFLYIYIKIRVSLLRVITMRYGEARDVLKSIFFSKNV